MGIEVVMCTNSLGGKIDYNGRGKYGGGRPGNPDSPRAEQSEMGIPRADPAVQTPGATGAKKGE